MKILLAHNSPYYPSHGGGDRSNRLLMEALAARGHHCRVVARTGAHGPKAQEDLVRQLSARGVPVLSSGSGVLLMRRNGVEVHTAANHPNVRAYFAAQLASFSPDIVVASTDDPAQLLLEAALRHHGPRIVYLARATLPLPFGPDCAFPSAAKAASLRLSDSLVGVSEYVAGYIRQWGGAPAVHVPISLLEPGPWPACGGFDNEFVTMVNPSATKGISIFLALAQAMPAVKFAAVPSWGTNAVDMERLRAAPNVTILDPVDDIAGILERSRVVLIPSLWAEARSRMVVESLLHGVPVLASDVGGLGEAMMGVPYLLPVRPIVKYNSTLDENMVPAAEIPNQDIGPWLRALTRVISDRAHWEDLSRRGGAAALAYAASLTVEPFERLLAATLDSPPKRDSAPPVSPPALTGDKRKLLALRLKGKRASAKPDDWFPSLEAPSSAGLRLFCFPFAGGGASFFRGWGGVLGPGFQGAPAALPGRETRSAETPFDSFDALLEALIAAIRPHLDSRPFAFFGHSMGAPLAFELARRLYAERLPMPMALLVSGARAPRFRLGHVPPPEPSDAQLLDQLRHVKGPDAPAEPLTAALRADTRAYRGYVYHSGSPLPIPICAFGGREDPQVTVEHLEAWKFHTGESFSMRLFPGGHFFLRDQALAFLGAVSEELASAQAALSRT